MNRLQSEMYAHNMPSVKYRIIVNDKEFMGNINKEQVGRIVEIAVNIAFESSTNNLIIKIEKEKNKREPISE